MKKLRRTIRIVGTALIVIGVGLALSPLAGHPQDYVFGALFGLGIFCWIGSFLI